MVSGVTLGIALVVGAEAGEIGAFQPLSSIGQRLALLLTRSAIVMPAFLLASCGMFADVWEWNQKLTVEVLVDGKVVSGSAVSHVWWQEANALGVYPSGYKGEATVVDLGQRGQLFALIGEETKFIAQHTLMVIWVMAAVNTSDFCRPSCVSAARRTCLATIIRCL